MNGNDNNDGNNNGRVGPLANEQVIANLPGNVIAQIDAVVGSEFTDREDFLRAAVRHYLEYLQHIQLTTQQSNIG